MIRFAAHELRTPISVARGYVDILRSGTLGPIPVAAREALSMVDGKLGEIAEVGTELVDIARLQAARTKTKTESLDMRALIREAVKRMQPMVGSAHRLVVDLPDRAATVVVDPVLIRAIVSNLLSNGIKYSPDGGEIRVKLRIDRRTVRVSVSDSGVGIKPQDLPNLFQPFSRLHEENLSGVSGMGLGLYIARETALAHGGELSAQPNKGAAGTTFELTLPAAKHAAAERVDAHPTPLAETRAEARFS
jgi:signal transduction histidine kinase